MLAKEAEEAGVLPGRPTPGVLTRSRQRAPHSSFVATLVSLPGFKASGQTLTVTPLHKRLVGIAVSSREPDDFTGKPSWPDSSSLVKEPVFGLNSRRSSHSPLDSRVIAPFPRAASTLLGVLGGKEVLRRWV